MHIILRPNSCHDRQCIDDVTLYVLGPRYISLPAACHSKVSSSSVVNQQHYSRPIMIPRLKGWVTQKHAKNNNKKPQREPQLPFFLNSEQHLLPLCT